MRFPDTPPMEHVFELLRWYELKLSNYRFENGNATLFYNGIRKKYESNPDTADIFNVTGIPEVYSQTGWCALVANVVNPFVNGLVNDAKGNETSRWKLMMKYDKYSSRAYMAGNRSDARPELDMLKMMPYPISVTNWLEMFASSTASYNNALSEAVLHKLASRTLRQIPSSGIA